MKHYTIIWKVRTRGFTIWFETFKDAWSALFADFKDYPGYLYPSLEKKSDIEALKEFSGY